jgi:hypothetical protein
LTKDQFYRVDQKLPNTVFFFDFFFVYRPFDLIFIPHIQGYITQLCSISSVSRCNHLFESAQTHGGQKLGNAFDSERFAVKRSIILSSLLVFMNTGRGDKK